MQVNTDKFIGGYEDNEIEEAREQGKELKGAMERLMNNPDFMIIYNHYTNQTILEEADKAGYSPDHRPIFFESILNRVAFKNYVQQLLSIQLDEVK